MLDLLFTLAGFLLLNIPALLTFAACIILFRQRHGANGARHIISAAGLLFELAGIAWFWAMPSLVRDINAPGGSCAVSLCGSRHIVHVGDNRVLFIGSTCHFCLLVGSRTGAILRRPGLSIAPRFLWECLTSRTVSSFPAPAASNVACGSPALRSPACFMSRFIGPKDPGRLSRMPASSGDNRRTAREHDKTTRYSTVSSPAPGAVWTASSAAGPSFLPSL
jgi:hypothetical protein